ncbi:hypothetical protein [Nocardioides sp. 1609]|uniref:hypothetical protein n=1 Tax=Nocardioides sp. 1609 TaxID=2508327 RepID=UPI00106FFE29|nr:hypothetical protein [Nocardioides sp. 1609]
MISLRAAAVTAVSAAVLLSPVPAIADGYTQVDAVRDVTRIDLDEEGDVTGTPARGESDTDIRSVRFDLGPRRLVIVAKMRSIGPRVRVFGVVRTKGTTYELMVTAGGRLRIDDRSEGRQTCEGAVARTTPATRAYRVAVPTSCLGDPRWARLGLAVARFRQTESEFSVVVDDVARTGYPNPDAEFALGPRITRG